MTVKSSKTLIAEALKEIETLDSTKVKELHDKKECTLIDIRDIRELWNTGKVEGALHIPRGMLEFWLDKESPYYRKEKFQDNKKIILFCAAGSRSALATKTLKEMGFNNVAHIDGGFQSMQLEGFNIIEAEKE
tara:strand:- start:20 stop:418 length:399 start_codon:yes stop_codon:yes gene_type:complete